MSVEVVGSEDSTFFYQEVVGGAIGGPNYEDSSGQVRGEAAGFFFFDPEDERLAPRPHQ